MAYRAMGYWRNMLKTMGENGNRRTFVTSTGPRMKAYAPGSTRTFDNPGQTKPGRPLKGDFVPVYVAVGLIALSAIFGIHTLNQQLRYNPAVRLKKTKRETFPEVEDPDGVVRETDNLINRSWFRKVAHVQEFDSDHAIPDPIRGDVYTRPKHAETLKSVEVDPKPQQQGH